MGLSEKYELMGCEVAIELLAWCYKRDSDECEERVD